MLTARMIGKNMKRLERINSILNLCKDFKNSNMVADINYYNQYTTKTDMDLLVHFGYMVMEVKPYGKFNLPSNYYKTINPVFNINDLPYLLERLAQKKEAAIKKEYVDVKPTLPGAVVYTSKSLAKKLIETSRLDRKNRKSPLNYISGASLSMF